MSGKRRPHPGRHAAGAAPTALSQTTGPGVVSSPDPAGASLFAGWRLATIAALILLNLAVYAPLRHHQFVVLDDPVYVTSNVQVTRGFTGPGVIWAFTTGHASNWHPLTWLSHMLDVQLFGLSAGPHHLVSLGLHVVNTILLFLLLAGLTGAAGRSAFVAALFAVHPLHVESVAWVAERKDVLSTLFWLLTIWAYVRYAADRRWSRYALVVVCFALGLMAKPMLVTLPFVLLLLDVWPLKRREAEGGRRQAGGGRREAEGGRRAPWTALVREKLPLFAMAAASSIVTIVVQRHGGAVGEMTSFPLVSRIANALVAYASYLRLTIWPSGLSVFYPYPASPHLAEACVALVALTAVSVLAVRSARRSPWLTVGWFWYFGTLLPVIGLVQVGRQAMADRYMYVPLIGIFIVFSWSAAALIERWTALAQGRKRTASAQVARGLALVVASLIILLYAGAARSQAASWKSSLTLWQHAIGADPQNYYAQTGLGLLAEEAGRHAEASRYFATALRIAPDYPEAHHGLGLALMNQGRTDEAIAEYSAAVQLRPDFVEARNNFGTALAARGRFDEAVTQYNEALRLSADEAKIRTNLGQALAGAGRIDEAIAQFQQAVRLRPDLAVAYDNLGLALYRLGRLDEAIGQYARALELNPASAGTHNNLGIALQARGRVDEAVAQYLEALRLEGDHADVHNNLGFALAGQGKVNEAIPHFVEAIRLRPDFEMAHLYLGLAFGATGRFGEAAAQFAEVLRIDPGNEAARRALEKVKPHAGVGGGR